jgi:lysophospholipase L1-like esterase
MEPGVMNLYFSIDWRPIPDHDSYGHDIETAYLMLEAEDVLGRGHDPRTERMAKLLVDHGLAFGWDETYGGFYRDGTTFGAAEDRAKEWWVQVEGLNALLLMHERYGKQTDVYFKAFLQQWQFIKEHQLDAQDGGLYDTVERNGTPTNFIKARIWKAAYHDGRALLNVTERLRRLAQAKPVANFIPADNKNIQYTGRIDFSDAKQPKFWASGTYLRATFKGTYCDVVVADEQLYGTSHNYLDIVVDAGAPQRVRTSGPVTTIRAAEGLTYGPHTITVTKDTESGIGFVQFLGFNCDALLAPPKRPMRKLEFIGDSITCGSSIDVSQVACEKGAWYDQHNAYLSYGPVTARTLNAEWQVTAVSGIGLIHSCCGMTVTMPQVFDKLNARANQAAWDFSLYQPDAVTVCLGQNDGIQDMATFQQRYVDFIADIRRHYPRAKIVCLNSPMADGRLDAFLQQNLTEIVARVKRAGDQNVSSFFVTAQLNDGCGRHPSLAQHQLVAREVSSYLRTLLKW